MRVLAPRSNRSRLLATSVSLVVLCFSFPALADLIHLSNGKTLHGEVINEDDKFVTVRVPYGITKIRKDQVDYVERQTPIENSIGLGLEYLDHSNYIKAREQIEEVVRKNPEEKGAKLALAKVYGAYAKHLQQVKRLSEAEHYFKQQLVLKPGEDDATRGLAKVEQDRAKLDGYIEQARLAMQAKNWDNAIRAFDDAFSFSPDARQIVANDLAKCLVLQAQEQYQRERFAEAALNLERAFGFDPTLADKLDQFYVHAALRWANAMITKGQVDQAQQLSKHVLELAPTNKQALYFAGNLDEATHNLPGAAECYARALRKPVTDVTAEQVAELRKQLETMLGVETKPDSKITSDAKADTSRTDSSDFKTIETTHFKILHKNETLAKEVAEVIEAHYDRITQALSYVPEWKENTRPKIYIHGTQEEYTLATQQPEWTGGVSRYAHLGNKLIKLEIHSWQTSPRLLKSVLPHELTHLLVNSQLPSFDAIPRAMHEGYSVLMEPAYRQNYFLGFLRMRLKSNDFIPLPILLDTKNYPSDPDFFYAEGFALVQYLVQTKGMKEALGLISNSNAGGEIQARLLGITGMPSIQAVEQDWKKWITRGSAVNGN